MLKDQSIHTEPQSCADIKRDPGVTALGVLCALGIIFIVLCFVILIVVFITKNHVLFSYLHFIGESNIITLIILININICMMLFFNRKQEKKRHLAVNGKVELLAEQQPLADEQALTVPVSYSQNVSNSRTLFLLRPVLPPEEYQRQVQSLLSLIVARTGLPLYDLRKDLPKQ